MNYVVSVSRLQAKNQDKAWLSLRRNSSAIDCPNTDTDCGKLGWVWPDGSKYFYPEIDWWGPFDSQASQASIAGNVQSFSPGTFLPSDNKEAVRYFVCEKGEFWRDTMGLIIMKPISIYCSSYIFSIPSLQCRVPSHQ